MKPEEVKDEHPHPLTGNQFWKIRTIHGRARLFSDAILLLEEAYKYFDWCDNNPWYKVELIKYQGSANQENLPLYRPYTMDGLTRYLGVSGAYFRTAKKELTEKIEKDKATTAEVELLETIETIEQIVRTQQIEGAAVGVFSANLVARINNLSDNTRVTTDGTVMRITVRDEDTANDLSTLENTLLNNGHD